ncbi:hypothetical protein ACFXGR_22850 [Streptomyces mirabilis]|uniref:hypothetical protein n=1 Tax=Streptomyces mirabilis TaxID=68239 RepID=UPI0036C24C5F
MDSTRSTYRIQYNHDRVLVSTTRGTISIPLSRLATPHRTANPADGSRYVPTLTVEQCARAEEMGARLRNGSYVFSLDQAAAVFAFAADVWGEPTDTNGYEIPAAEPKPTETPAAEQATEADPTRTAARIIYEHGDLLYAALQDYIAAETQRFPTADPELLQDSYEVASSLAEHIADVMQALKSPDLWTIATVAEYISATTTGSARKTLSRWGVKPVGREAGRGGESLYDPEQVRAAKASRPGRGTRTDLPKA